MKSTKEIIKWFEDLLGVENITFLYGADNKVFNGNGYDFDCQILTRKILYFDTTNNIISTHSPYGSNWEKRKDVKKLKADENFRWIIQGEDFLSSTKLCNVNLLSYNGNVENLGCFNEDKVVETMNKLYQSLQIIMKYRN